MRFEAQAAPPAAAPAAAAPAADRPELVELGRLLFFDPRFSQDGLVSCATCHDPKKGWTDHRDVAIGAFGKRGRRHTQTLLNVAYRFPLFWDGRATSLEDQVHFPFSESTEMALPIAAVMKRLAGIPGYRPYFARAFGSEAPTPQRLAQAIAAFERTIVSLDSPYDRFAAGDAAALSPAAARGLKLFNSKARCFICHELAPGKHQQFVNLGLSSEGRPADLGRFEVTRSTEGEGGNGDRRAFRVPDLHGLLYTGPYMHDGSLKTLAQVVDFYDSGGGPDPDKSPWVLPLHLTAAEKEDLVRFLEALSGPPFVVEPPRELPR